MIIDYEELKNCMDSLTFGEKLVVKLLVFLIEFIGKPLDGFYPRLLDRAVSLEDKEDD